MSTSMREQYLDIGDQRLCVCQWGQPGRPIILLLHGILQQGASWEPIATPLAEAGYFVVAPDLRGHGRSAQVARGGPHTALGFVLDVDRVLRGLEGGRVLLAGHSLGGALAATFARIRSNRVAGLVLIEPVLPPEEADTRLVEDLTSVLDGFVAAQRPLAPLDLQAAARWLLQYNPSLSPQLGEFLARRATEPCPEGIRWSWDPALRVLASLGPSLSLLWPGGRRKYVRLLREIDIPTTLIYGSDSPGFDADRSIYTEAISHCRDIVLSGGHNLQFEAPHQVFSHIGELAREVLPPPGG